MMADTCAYRIAGNDVAAEAAYEEWRRAVNPSGYMILTPYWNELPESAKVGWRNIFRVGHRAYRDYIRWENGLIHDESVAETLAHLENVRRNSEVAPEPGSETPPDWEHKEY